MSAQAASAVLHITAAAGSGVDRYIRDLAAHTPRRHFVLHAGAEIDVLEDIGAGRFFTLRNAAVADPAAIAHWLPSVVSLHDLQFVDPHAFDLPGMPEPEPVWIARVGPTLARAASVIAPSSFVRAVALQCVPGLEVTLIPPGIRAAGPADAAEVPPDFAAHAPRHVVAVVGAIGPHAGSDQLDALAAALDGSDIGVVVIGYTDTQLTRGWRVPGRLYVHGPYVDDALAGWLAAYRVEVALFPNRRPESFSYTLSEV